MQFWMLYPHQSIPISEYDIHCKLWTFYNGSLTIPVCLFSLFSISHEKIKAGVEILLPLASIYIYNGHLNVRLGFSVEINLPFGSLTLRNGFFWSFYFVKFICYLSHCRGSRQQILCRIFYYLFFVCILFINITSIWFITQSARGSNCDYIIINIIIK